ncbi:hypothetical protein [Natribacillus halophilus]|uniref:Uncharacterized protein n=1 Tax=Natribacillus halophilus TaxID=549003 RepID=A0A1G8SL76_9BACI|nr:hypothetical protein [Natribacillus halophilus]SDJ29495.1 hypothetical protein SAMN04488123_1302 [Natribacillus halophilus]
MSRTKHRSMTPVDPDEQHIDVELKGSYADGRGKDTEEEKEITRNLVRKYKEEHEKSSE